MEQQTDIVSALETYLDVPKDRLLEYVKYAMEHRTRCSMWLAEIDIALGSASFKTQAAGEAGMEAQDWRAGNQTERGRDPCPRAGPRPAPPGPRACRSKVLGAALERPDPHP